MYVVNDKIINYAVFEEYHIFVEELKLSVQKDILGYKDITFLPTHQNLCFFCVAYRFLYFMRKNFNYLYIFDIQCQ